MMDLFHTARSWIAALATGLLLATSCRADLDITPENQPSDATWWTTPEQFSSASASFYPYLAGFNPLQDFQQPYNLENDRFSDLATDSPNTFSQGVYLPQNSMGVWTRAYVQLRNINNLLDKSRAYAGDPAGIRHTVGEAHFFRAYVYFRLLLYFGGVPLVTRPLGTSSPGLYAPRASREATVNFILGELDSARQLLLPENSLSAAAAGRAGQFSALAFKGRVALFEGTWQKFRGQTARANTLLDQSAAASDVVMRSGQYQLFSPLADSSYRYLFILENQRSNPGGFTKNDNHEYLLANHYDFNLRTVGYNISHTSPGAPTQKLARLYLCRDGLPPERSPLFRGYAGKASEFGNREARMRNTFRIPGRVYWDYSNARYAPDGSLSTNPGVVANPNPTNTPTGYFSNKFRTERAIGPLQDGFDYPIIRYPEVLLNYAEAVYERNDYIGDADLNRSLNVVRTNPRVGLPPLSNGFVAGNGLNMRTEIRRERTVELIFEGFRFFDLLRWKTAETEMPQSLLGVKFTGSEFGADPIWQGFAGRLENGFIVADPAAGRRFDASRNYLLPLPLAELAINPQLVQNPGW